MMISLSAKYRLAGLSRHGLIALLFSLVTAPLQAAPADTLKLPSHLLLAANQPWLSRSLAEPRAQMTASRLAGFVELGGLASSSGITPFWLQTNQYGVVPAVTPAGLIRLNVSRSYRRDSLEKRPRTGLGYGLELAGQQGQITKLLVVEAYLKARWGLVELVVGRRRQRVGLAESALSSGSYIWSGNALPIPQVQIGLPEYVPIGFTKGWVALKGNIAHGWFGHDPYVQGAYLHQKAIYLRVGRPQAKVQLYGAFTHFAQWGGYAPFLEQDPSSSFDGQLAQSWDAFVNVILPINTNALKNRAKFTSFDQNRVGDHRGTAEVAMDVRLSWGILRFYQQHFYDIGRKLYNFRNIEDGLYGLHYLRNSPQRGFLREVVLELFNSGNQGVYQFGRSLGGEAENYFLNGQYPSSWSYQGRTIGTPFITQSSQASNELPRLPFSGSTMANQLINGVHGINNNRVWALYAGLTGRLGSAYQLEARLSYSRNYGTFSAPFPAGTTQWSAMGSVIRSGPKQTQLIVSLGYDQGRLLASPQQLGGYVGLRKHWSPKS